MSFSTPYIVPALLESDIQKIEEKLALVEGLATWAQIDVCDGRFVPSVTFNSPQALVNTPGTIKLEAHLMVEHPEAELREWMQVVDRVLVHYESTENFSDILDIFDSSPVEVGVSLLMDTPVEELVPHFKRLSHIQLMGIAEIGAQGHLGDTRIFEKVRTLRALWPDGTIAVDGGVNAGTIIPLVESGAQHLVVGSALFGHGTVQENFAALAQLLNGALTRRENTVS